jgi:hypothetical protein
VEPAVEWGKPEAVQRKAAVETQVDWRQRALFALLGVALGLAAFWYLAMPLGWTFRTLVRQPGSELISLTPVLFAFLFLLWSLPLGSRLWPALERAPALRCVIVGAGLLACAALAQGIVQRLIAAGLVDWDTPLTSLVSLVSLAGLAMSTGGASALCTGFAPALRRELGGVQAAGVVLGALLGAAGLLLLVTTPLAWRGVPMGAASIALVVAALLLRKSSTAKIPLGRLNPRGSLVALRPPALFLLLAAGMVGIAVAVLYYAIGTGANSRLWRVLFGARVVEPWYFMFNYALTGLLSILAAALGVLLSSIARRHFRRDLVLLLVLLLFCGGMFVVWRVTMGQEPPTHYLYAIPAGALGLGGALGLLLHLVSSEAGESKREVAAMLLWTALAIGLAAGLWVIQRLMHHRMGLILTGSTLLATLVLIWLFFSARPELRGPAREDPH